MPLQHDLIVQNKRQAFGNFPPPKIISPSGSSLSRRQMNLRRGGVKSSLDSCSPASSTVFEAILPTWIRDAVLKGKVRSSSSWGPSYSKVSPSVYSTCHCGFGDLSPTLPALGPANPGNPGCGKEGEGGRLGREWP